LGQALYRKYRSKSLSEIVGQEHVTKTLARAIKDGKISHAYLLTGPRGVGKTSIARILAHEVNGLPYTDESIHLDIIEIDAASNRRIDEIRELRDKVHIAPSSAKYKVYIIDEVHMLTKEAFNALLKTLEEPPAHVIFILATTEVHKLPETIVSRTQRFTFKAIDHDKAIGHLKEIAKKEGMQVDDGAFDLLAEHGRGSFRDAISLLDQVGHSKDKITRADVEQLIGIAPKEAVQSLLEATSSGDPKAIVDSMDVFTEQGIAPAQVAKQLAALVRSNLLSRTLTMSQANATSLLAHLLDVPASQEPGTALELALFKAAPLDMPIAAPPAKPQASKPAASTITVKTIQPEEKPAEAEPEPVVVEPARKPLANAEDIRGWWPQLVNSIKQHNNTLYGVLRMAHPELEAGHLRLSYGFGLHAKKTSDPQTSLKIQEAIKVLTGEDITIEVIYDKALKGQTPNLKIVTQEEKSLPEVKAPDASDLGVISSIFGGGEVLES